MARFVADTLDLSRLPAPTVIKSIDYESILAERLAKLKVELPDWDADTVEADPALVVQEIDAFREVLDKQRINEAAKAVMLPYAEKSDLDVIGSLFGVERLADEEDEPYRRRIGLAPEAYASAGSAGAYEFHARSVSTRIVDVGVTCPRPGVAQVVLLFGADTSAADAAALVTAVNARLQSDEIRPLTDQVVVLVAEIVPFAVNVRISVPPGPDPSVIEAAAAKSLAALASGAYRVGRSVDASEISGAAWSSNARKVEVLSGAVSVTEKQAPLCTSIVARAIVAKEDPSV